MPDTARGRAPPKARTTPGEMHCGTAWPSGCLGPARSIARLNAWRLRSPDQIQIRVAYISRASPPKQSSSYGGCAPFACHCWHQVCRPARPHRCRDRNRTPQLQPCSICRAWIVTSSARCRAAIAHCGLCEFIFKLYFAERTHEMVGGPLRSGSAWLPEKAEEGVVNNSPLAACFSCFGDLFSGTDDHGEIAADPFRVLFFS